MVERRRLLLVKRNWRNLVAWLLILVVAGVVIRGADPFVPLIVTVLGIAIYEFGRRWLARERTRRIATPQQTRP